MKSIIIIAILFLKLLSCFGAQGDLIGFGIETNGWIARLTFEKLNTNGMFYPGFQTNNTISSTNMLTLTVRSMGYDSSGNGLTTTRTIYGTKALRRPYPEMSGSAGLTNDFMVIGNDVVIRVALSDWIFALDSNIVVSVSAGAFAVTNGTGTNCLVASAISWATNNSIVPYPPPVCNWAWPGYNILPSNFTARVVGDAAYGIACVRFVYRDTNGYAFTNFQTARQIDYTMQDKVPVLEYIAPMRQVDSASGNAMSNGSPGRLDFTVYPKVGNITLDTMDGLFNLPFYCTQTNICDRVGTYGAVTALVATNGNNSTGVAVTNFNSAVPPLPFLDIGTAMNAIRLTNSILFTRTNASGGMILLSNGQFTAFGTVPNIANLSPGWLTIAPFPGLDKSSCSITGSVNYTDNHRLHVTNIFMNSAMTFDWYGQMDLWFDHCAFNESSTTYFQGPTNVYFTQCSVTNLKNGFYGQSTKVVVPVLIRGNDLTGLASAGDVQGLMYTVIGNGQDRPGVGGNGLRWVTTTSGGLQPNPDGIIFCFNKIMCFSNDSNTALSPDSFTLARGACVEQNIVEATSGAATAINSYIFINTNCTNILLRNNVFVGQRCACFYDWLTGVATYHTFKSTCFANGNVWIDYNIKADNEPTQDSSRIGNWSCLYGVGWSYNMFPEQLPTTQASGSFMNEFNGLNSFMNASARDGTGQPSATTTASNFCQFVQQAFAANTFIGVGMGNYRWQSSSPFILPGYAGKSWLEYDIEGNARGLFDPPGAYTSGNIKKGNFFHY